MRLTARGIARSGWMMRMPRTRPLIIGLAVLTMVMIAPLRRGVGQTSLFTILDLNVSTEARVNFARSINLLNQVAGRSGAVNGASTRGMLWGLGGSITPLGVLNDGDYSAAFSLNDIGETVGSSNTGTVVRAVLWRAGTLQLLDI